MGTSNSSNTSQHITGIVIEEEQSANRSDDDLRRDRVWETQHLQLIKKARLHIVLEQVCSRLESLMSNPNDSRSRNELGNALRLLAARIDCYNQLTRNLRLGNINIERNLLHIQVYCQNIEDVINEVNGSQQQVQQLSAEEVALFKELAQDFLSTHRPFCAKLLRDVEEHMDEKEVYSVFEKAKESFRRLKEFVIRNWRRIAKGALSGACGGAATGLSVGAAIGAFTPIPIATVPGAAIGVGVGAAAGAFLGGGSVIAALLSGALKDAKKRHVQ